MPLFCPHAADVCDRPAEVTLKVQPVKPLSFLRLVPLLDLVVWLNGWLNTGREKTPTNTGSHTIWQEASAATDKHTYNNDVVRITHTHTHAHPIHLPFQPTKIISALFKLSIMTTISNLLLLCSVLRKTKLYTDEPKHYDHLHDVLLVSCLPPKHLRL